MKLHPKVVDYAIVLFAILALGLVAGLLDDHETAGAGRPDVSSPSTITVVSNQGNTQGSTG